MTPVQRYAIVAAVAGCFVSIAWFAHIPSKSRVAFDNNGYPASIGVELWLDDDVDGRLMRATCTIDHCETEPTLMQHGRHRVRLRVLVNGQASQFTVTTLER